MYYLFFYYIFFDVVSLSHLPGKEKCVRYCCVDSWNKLLYEVVR